MSSKWLGVSGRNALERADDAMVALAGQPVERETARMTETALPDLRSRTILQIIPELSAGGAERTTLEVAEAIMEAGGRAIVASEGGRLVPALEALGALDH